MLIGTLKLHYLKLCVWSLGFSIYKIMPSVSRDNFYFSFSIWMPLLSFSCLTGPSRISTTRLKRSVKRWSYLSCFWSYRKSLQSVTIKCDIRLWKFYECPYIRLRKFLPLVSRLFIVIKECWFFFFRTIFLHQFRWSYGLLLHSINVVYYINFHMVNNP